MSKINISEQLSTGASGSSPSQYMFTKIDRFKLDSYCLLSSVTKTEFLIEFLIKSA